MPAKPTYEELLHRVSELELAVKRHKENEETLHRQAQVLHSIKDTILIITPEMRTIYANQTAKSIFGDRPEMFTEPCYRYFKNRDTACENCPVQRAIEDGKPHKAIMKSYDRNGEEMWRFNSAFPFYDQEGKLIAGIEIVTDYTPQKRSETALRKSEERYRALFEHMSDGVVIYEAVDAGEDFIFLDFNKAAEKIENISKEALVGKSLLHVFPGVKEFGLLDVLKRVWQTGTPEHHPLALYTDDRITGWRENFVCRLPSGEVVAIYSDETEHQRAAEALKKSESTLQSVFAAAPVGICLMKDRVYQRANRNWCESFGYPEESLIGRTPDFLYESMEEYERVGRKLYGYLRQEGVASARTRLKRSDGEFRDVILIAEPLNPRNLTDGVVTVVHDITDQTRAETQRKELEDQLRQSQKMEAIGTLAGGIAHDFNNLLMSIQGRTSMVLVDKDLSHPDFEHLREIERNIESAARLTKQILSFARGGKYEVRPTDLNELVKKESRMFGRTKKEVTLFEDYDDSLWPVKVDRGQIQQVMLNLYVNAWQAMPGGGSLHIRTRNVILDENNVKPHGLEPGPYVQISVRDTGIGMDRATQQRIFDPFFTTKDQGTGTGLGLASTYSIIKDHSGFVQVFSEKGSGSTFDLFLPAHEEAVVEVKRVDHGEFRGSETVLFVDDEEMISEVVENWLKRLGYNALMAQNGKEAVRIYEKNRGQIDLVVLDMIMPDMSGAETFARMKDINPDVKVLLSSGYSIDGQATELLNQGCKGFIQKPFKMEELSKKLREILES
jgi:two-component system cell cycle sensor histidine kinase/response regulator CckA